VFSRTAAQDAKSRAAASAKQAKAGARLAADRARLATTQATTQFTPLARSAQLTLGRGVYGARVWAAPRVEATGVAVQERLAPKVSSVMIETARRLQPPQAARRRRWPVVAGGIALLAAGGAAAAVLRLQRKAAPAEPFTPAPASAPGQPQSGPDLGDSAQADVNGQVRTP
jgi:hypothetical protein